MQWFKTLDLKGKISLALVSGSLAIAAVIAVASFVYFRHLLVEHVTAALNAEARLEKREIELLIAGTLSQLESLAANTVTANALADSNGRETYLVPLFANLKLPVRGASVELTDYLGRTIVKNGDSAFGNLDRSTVVNAVGNTPVSKAFISQALNGQATLTVAMPVIYRLTNNVEGLVVLGLPLESLILRDATIDAQAGSDVVRRRIESGAAIATGNPPGKGSIVIRAALSLPRNIAPLPLELVVSSSQNQLDKDLRAMIVLYLIFGGVIVVVTIAIASKAAMALSAPLRHLSSVTEEIAASGRPSANMLRIGNDEFGRLAQAFNRMVERLAESYAVLELRVEERTRALRNSESRLRYVMDATGEGIWDWNVNTGIVIHNTTWCDLLGLDLSFLEHPIEQFADVLHPDDRQKTMELIQKCVESGSPYYHEHRLVRPDGGIVWVLDRGAVVERDRDGKASRMVGSISDITVRRLATTALTERELYLRATLDNLPFMFWLKDTEGRLLAVNKLFATACGRQTPDELVGLTDRQIWPAGLGSIDRHDDSLLMQAGAEEAVEESVLSGAEARWIETYKKAVIANDGALVGTVGFARDITQRKQMEKQLAASEQRWELAVSGANDGIWDWAPHTGELFVSERWKTMLGYDVDEIGPEYTEWTSRIHPDDLDGVMDAIQRHLNRETPFYQTEHRLRCKNGDYKWILDRGRALFDEQGTPIRMSGSHTDITEPRSAQARLQDRTEQLNAIFALSPDGFVSFDNQHRVKYVSQAFQRMSGFSEDELVGISEQDLVERLNGLCGSNSGLTSIAALLEATTSGEPHGRELIELTHPTRRVLEVGIRTSRAETVSQILYFRDVTHETEVDRMKSEFLSTAAHELRTPMASVYGFSELLLAQEFDPATQRELLGTIFRQSQLMSSIINELLDLARIEARRGKDFVIERIDTEQLLTQVADSYKVPAGRQPPTLMPSAKVRFARGDRNKLFQSMTNILSNAYKYSPAGGEIVISIETAPETHPNLIGLRVRDSGIGMTEEQIARVGERFYRADTSGKIPGTGLGMAIVKEIADLHRGQIEISSRLREGTTVTLWIPDADRR